MDNNNNADVLQLLREFLCFALLSWKMRNFIMPSLYHKILGCKVASWPQMKFILFAEKKLLNLEDEISGWISSGREGEKP